MCVGSLVAVSPLEREVICEEASAFGGGGSRMSWGRGGCHTEMEPHFLDDWVEGPSC